MKNFFFAGALKVLITANYIRNSAAPLVSRNYICTELGVMDSICPKEKRFIIILQHKKKKNTPSASHNQKKNLALPHNATTASSTPSLPPPAPPLFLHNDPHRRALLSLPTKPHPLYHTTIPLPSLTHVQKIQLWPLRRLAHPIRQQDIVEKRNQNAETMVSQHTLEKNVVGVVGEIRPSEGAGEGFEDD